MDFKSYISEENRARTAIGLMRISIGVLFLKAAFGKISAGSDWPERMLGFLSNQKNTPDWYRTIVESVVVPNAELFGFLTAYGELALGLALVLGVMTRPALLAGVFMVANFFFAKGAPFWAPSNHDSLYILIMLMLYFNAPGHVLGFDHKVAEKFPKLPI